MLSWPRLGTAAVAAGLLWAATVPPVVADGPGGGVVCPPRDLDCDVTAQDPGKPAPGKPGGRPGKPPSDGACPRARSTAQEVPCSTPEMGTFSAADSCYWKVLDPPPQLPGDFDTGAPAGWKPGDGGGALYLVTCP